MIKFDTKSFQELGKAEAKVEYAVNYLWKIVEKELNYEIAEADEDGFIPSSMKLDVVLAILEEFAPLLNKQEGIRIRTELHETLLQLLSTYHSGAYLIKSGEIAEILAFLLIKAEELDFNINAKNEFHEYIETIKMVQEKERKRREVHFHEEYDEAEYAQRQYNLMMDWQEGEISDEDYASSPYRY